MFRKGLKLGAAVLLVLSLVLAGCGADTAKAPDNGGQAGGGNGDSAKVLKVGSDIAYAPFEFFDESQKPAGFDMELITAIAKEMGYQVEIETAAFDGLIMALNSGKYDAIISAMTITEERAESVQFSDPYFESSQLIAVKEGSSIKSKQDLVDKTIGVQVTTTGQYAVEKLGINPEKFDTTPEAMLALKNGSVEAVVADSPVVLYFIQQNPGSGVVAVEDDFEKEYYGIAFRKSDTELVEKANAALKKFMEDGTYNDIYKKWFGKDAPKF